MSAYLYVLWAIEDELVKIGISKSPSGKFRFVTKDLQQVYGA